MQEREKLYGHFLGEDLTFNAENTKLKCRCTANGKVSWVSLFDSKAPLVWVIKYLVIFGIFLEYHIDRTSFAY